MRQIASEQVFRLTSEKTSFVLSRGVHEVGSSEHAVLRIPNRSVSRRHAIMSVTDAVRVEDLGSRNGTFVEGRQVREVSLLRVGQTIRFGPCEFLLEEVPRSDVELALEVGSRVSETPSFGSGDTSRLTLDKPADSLARIEAWMELLLSPEVGTGMELLRSLVGQFDAHAGRVSETLNGGEPNLVAEWGEFTETEELVRFRWSGTDGAPSGRQVEVSLAGVDAGSRAKARRWAGLLARFLAMDRRTDATGPWSAKDTELVFPPGFVPGVSSSARRMLNAVEQVAGHDVAVLIQGETGVGKEYVARILHESSPRRGYPLVAVNCAALAGSMLEAEMFGVAKGAATGVSARPGAFVAADGGTLFLDEVGEMPKELQSKLLRALQSGEIQPVGGPAKRVDVRLVAATNRDLRDAVSSGDLRADLYYRIAATTIVVPPLRERPDDLLILVQELLERISQATERRVRGVTVRAMELLRAYSWPGNIRELENLLTRLVLSTPNGGVLDGSKVEPELRLTNLPRKSSVAAWDLKARVEQVEADAIRQALRESGGSQRRAAKLLDISRNTLAERIRSYGIEA